MRSLPPKVQDRRAAGRDSAPANSRSVGKCARCDGLRTAGGYCREHAREYQQARRRKENGSIDKCAVCRKRAPEQGPEAWAGWCAPCRQGNVRAKEKAAAKRNSARDQRLAGLLREARLSLKLKPAQVAAEVGITWQRYVALEQGRAAAPGGALLADLARVLGLDLEDLTRR
jgi:DNA-binding XRE family transcriptional regulator